MDTMSYVTDVTVILTDWHDKARLKSIVQYWAGFTPAAVELSGPNCTGCDTYALGLDYALPELLDALLAGPWSPGTVVYIHDEGWVRPQITVFGAEPVGGWASTPEVAR